MVDLELLLTLIQTIITNNYLIPIIIRRLNDLNYGRFHLFLLLIPGFNFLFYLWTFLSTDSQNSINKYGFSKKIIFPDISIIDQKKGPWNR